MHYPLILQIMEYQTKNKRILILYKKYFRQTLAAQVQIAFGIRLRGTSP
jgi:hypothetical protein